MKVKICGMKVPANISEIADLKPDYMGFIFYDKSPRSVINENIAEFVKSLPKTINKTGVFVNESVKTILKISEAYDLNSIQLHGNETIQDCMELKKSNYELIKAFQIHKDFDFNSLNPYVEHCDHFLFDTASKSYGGSGASFDWRILKKYTQEKTFFLSGGIGLDNIEEALKLKHNRLYAFDINSQLEEYPGFKSVTKTKTLFTKIKTNETVYTR
jgi:phosphoribosylanthranilate isomerase